MLALIDNPRKAVLLGRFGIGAVSVVVGLWRRKQSGLCPSAAGALVGSVAVVAIRAACEGPVSTAGLCPADGQALFICCQAVNASILFHLTNILPGG